MPWARAKLQIISGEADVIFPASYEDVIDINGERVLLHNTLPIVLVKHAQMDDRWNGSLKSLEGKSIASHRGMLISREFNEFSAAEKFEVASTEQLFKLVQLRRVDFAITDWLTAKYMLERKAFKDLVVVSPPHIASSELYLGISSITKNREDIRLGFEDGLAYLKQSGKYQEILAQYKINDNVQLLKDQRQSKVFLEPSRLRLLKGSGLLPLVKKSSAAEVKMAIVGFDWGTDTYQRTYKQHFEKIGAKLGINITFHDARGSIEQQNVLMKTAVDSKPDVIALWPVHGEKVRPGLEYAEAASVPVFIINTPVAEELWVYVRGYIGPDNYKEGQLAAQMMEAALDGKGRVVEIQGFPGYKTAVLRSLGFHHYLQQRRLQDSNFDIEVIDVVSGYWSRERAYTAMQRLMRRHSQFDGLYAADDNMAIGAMQALWDAKRPLDFKVTSATLFGDGYDAIKQGKIWGSVWQSPLEEAELAVNTLADFALGEDVPLLTFLPVRPITKLEIEQTERPKF
ncbi:substrate-binding domain-containing protein [Alteromonas gracilis]|uniref:substrate-binding domain-containing protein n=1 Tax=Alteromonas gracilis TaxID=1479524 RepID=UPI003736A500